MAHPEEFLISTLLNRGNVLEAENLGVTNGHFHEYKAEYEWITDYKIKHKNEPSIDRFKAAFPDFRIRTHADLEESVEEVKRSHLSWSLTRLTRELMNKLKEKEPEQALELLSQKALHLKRGIDQAQSLANSLEDYSASLDFALERLDSTTPLGVPFNHPTLQERTMGMKDGDLWVKAARLGQGKTWDLINDSAEALDAGKKVLFYSLEMNRRSMEYRFQTVLGRRHGFQITHDMLDKGRGLDLLDYKRMLQVLHDQVPGELYINDTTRGRITPTSIAAGIVRYEPDLVVVDYLTLLASSTGQRSSEGWNVVASIVGDLKEVATQFQTPILTASQINREGDTSGWLPPRAKNLTGSDAIGQDSDGIVTMKRFGKGAMVYLLDKNRSGVSGDIWFSAFDPNNGDFQEISKLEAEIIRERDGEADDD